MFEDAKNNTSGFTSQYNPTTYGPNVGGVGKWTGLSGVGAKYQEYDKYKHMSADELKSHQFSPLLRSSLSAINATDSLGYDYPAYKAAINDAIKKGDTERLYAILQELVKRQNAKYPDSARILDINEPFPEEWLKSRADSSSTRQNPTYDDRKNGFWVPLRLGVNTPEAQAIRYLIKGDTGLISRSSAFRRSAKNAKEITKGIYDAAGISADTIYSLINNAEASAANKAGSPRDRYAAAGKLFAQLEVLKDSGDIDTVNKVQKNIDAFYNKLCASDVDAQTYINIFMSKYYIEYSKTYPETLLRQNPDIAKKKEDASKFLSKSDTYWKVAKLNAKSDNYDMTMRALRG